VSREAASPEESNPEAANSEAESPEATGPEAASADAASSEAEAGRAEVSDAETPDARTDTSAESATPEQAGPAAEAGPAKEAGPDNAEASDKTTAEKPAEEKTGEDWRYNFDKHKSQPSPRPRLEDGSKTESHHPQSQARLSEALANYSPREHPTILAPKSEHAALTKEQMTEMRTMDRDQYAREIGTTNGMVRANTLMTDVGIPENKAGEAIMREDGYLKGTTPLDKVGETVRDYWASKGMKPP